MTVVGGAGGQVQCEEHAESIPKETSTITTERMPNVFMIFSSSVCKLIGVYAYTLIMRNYCNDAIGCKVCSCKIYVKS